MTAEESDIITDCHDILLDLSDDGYECLVLKSPRSKINIIIKGANELRPPMHHESDCIGRLNQYLELSGYIMLNWELRRDITEYQQYEYTFVPR